MLQLGLEAEKSWRRITESERLADVISGVHFIDGEVEALVNWKTREGCRKAPRVPGR